MTDARGADPRVAELRRAFDGAFALPPGEGAPDAVDLLLVVAGGQPAALRLSDLAGLEVDRTVVPVPGDAPALLGLCAVRGQLVPVFALAALLGTDVARPSARWIALHRERDLLGLAFDEFQGSRRVAAQDVNREAIRVDGRVIHVVDIPALVSRLRQTMGRR